MSARELFSMKRFEELVEDLNNLKLISEWQFGEMLPRSAGRGWAQNLVAPCTSSASQDTWGPLRANRQCAEEVQVQPGNSWPRSKRAGMQGGAGLLRGVARPRQEVESWVNGQAVGPPPSQFPPQLPQTSTGPSNLLTFEQLPPQWQPW